LAQLLDAIALVQPITGRESLAAADASRRVAAVAYDSRRAQAGAVFFALRGERADGASFAADARARGAIAVVAETPAPDRWEGPWFVTPDARRALARAAAEVHGRPSHRLRLVGITGTNGKTTTAHIVRAIVEASGQPCGLIGTTGHVVGGVARDTERTTPEAPDLQQLLADMAAHGATACVMEVSSHALALRRVEDLRFAAGLFTNLTRDHLDYHGTMEAYFQAKRHLFELLPPGAPAVVNVDDPAGVRLAAEFAATTYGLDRPADVAFATLSSTLDGIRGELRTPHGPVPVASPLVGRPNAYNVLAAAATAVALGLPAGAIAAGLAALAHVPGRFQTVSAPGDDITVVVDYAHTDDALRNLLETARPLTRGRLITVFGCGGDRDRSKRPLMGAIAARSSDLVVITSDNPRSEDPERIIDEIKRGLVPPDRPLVRGGLPVAPLPAVAWAAIVDRRAAIAHAVRTAAPGDLVVVAGKGHETYQVVGKQVLPFDDVEVARELLAERRAHQGAGAGGGR
jgi:UDP-N-acetylmuramoyl-L-alanyl-D-glutamate--2,6-diaminopimelate ligase